MSKQLIANPPSLDEAQALIESVNKTRTFQITPAVREAIRNAMSKDHYEESTTYLLGGKQTGSKLADGYAFARKVVEWEVELGSIGLQVAIERRDILLNDIVKRIPAELRKLGFDVESWTILGMLIEKLPEEAATQPDLEVVNG